MTSEADTKQRETVEQEPVRAKAWRNWYVFKAPLTSHWGRGTFATENEARRSAEAWHAALDRADRFRNKITGETWSRPQFLAVLQIPVAS